MTPGIRQWPDESLERRAYDAVQPVPVVEENDRNRLGYHIFLYLKGEYPTIDEAIHLAQPRLQCSKSEASRMIAELLGPRAESNVS